MWHVGDSGSKGCTANSDRRGKPASSESRKGLGEQRKSRFKVAAYNANGLAF